jgi:7-cyano-7-deazaguanine synthase
MVKKAVCVISGGMDSALSTKIAQNSGYEVIGVHFNYRQLTEAKELECFRSLTEELGVQNKYEIELPFFSDIGASALTDSTIPVPDGGVEDGVPVTYVPFRNGIFLSIAASIAEKEGAEAIFIGVVQEDSSGYLDCTEEFIIKMQNAINQGTKFETKISIEMPLVHLSKAQIVKQSLDNNVPLKLTWSCYKNSEKACGLCDSCRLRLNGFKQANAVDQIEYVG